MEWKDVSSVVGKAAPIVGTLLGGPAGAAVGGLISAALGTTNTPDAVSAELAGNPDAIVKVQELQINAKIQLQQLAVTAEQNRLADVQNARARQTANPKDYTPQFLAGGVTLGFFGALAAVMVAPLSNSVHDLLLVMIGALQSAWIAVISYYFGSSKDSAGQTRMIADVGYAAANAPINIQAPAPPQPVTAYGGPGQQGDIYSGGN